MENGTILSIEKSVCKNENTVVRPAQPWTPHIHAYLRFLGSNGFPAPQPIAASGNGDDVLTFIEGDFVHPNKWSDDALAGVSRMVKQLHRLGGMYSPADDAVFQPWFLRGIGNEKQIISHGDISPWNMVTTPDGMPKALIDWEFAGYTSPLTEFARVCWLFVQLHDDDLADKFDLPDFECRAKQVRLMADEYGLTAAGRAALTERIIDVVVLETAQEAIDGNIVPGSVGQLWGLAWRARSAGKIIRNKRVLENALL